MADMVQSAGRCALINSFPRLVLTICFYSSILRAMFEICLKHSWAVPAKAVLDLCKMVEKGM